MWQHGLVRGHVLYAVGLAKRTISRRHRKLQVEDDRQVRLQRRGTACWDHPVTCATAGKQAVSVSGAARAARDGAMDTPGGRGRAKSGQEDTVKSPLDACRNTTRHAQDEPVFLSNGAPTDGWLVPRVIVLQTVIFIVFDPLLPSPWSVKPPLTAARSI